MLKALVGGDHIEAEGKGLNDRVLLTGHFNVIITCNERLMVRLEGDTDAWRRRLLIVRFESPPPEKKIADFGRLLFQEEGPGILAWAVAGAMQLLADFKEIGADYRLASSQLARVDSLLDESDSLRQFLDARVEKVRGNDITKDELLSAYGAFCEERGWLPMKKRFLNSQVDNLMLEMFQASESRSIMREDDNGSARPVSGFRRVRLKEEE